MSDSEYQDTPQHLAATGDDLHHEELFDEEGHFVGAHGHGDHHHVTPFMPMFMTLVILIVLTVVTVLTAKFIYLPGVGNIVLALVIACVKATLVAAFFMHLLYDKAVNTVVVIATMFAILLFIVLTMTDIGTRKLHEPLESGEIVAGGGARWIEEDGKRRVQVLGDYGPPLSAAPGKSVLQSAREAYAAAHGGKHGEGHNTDHGAEGHADEEGHTGADGDHADDAHGSDEANHGDQGGDEARANAPASTESAAPH